MDRVARSFRRDWRSWSAGERRVLLIIVAMLLPILLGRIAVLLA
jgi:hypothetical protein